jgi:primosomal protein N' (replication factor Y)
VSAGPIEAVASVAVPLPPRRLFAYRVSADQQSRLEIGMRVRVPFGRRRLEGTVVEYPAAPPEGDRALKTIEALLDDRRRLPAEVLELTRFVADYYLCSWGEAIPQARGARRLAAADPDALPKNATAMRKLLERLPEDGSPLPLARLGPAERRVVGRLCDRGWVERVDLGVPAPPSDSGAPSAEAERPPLPTPAQSEVLDRLAPAIDGETYAPFLLYGATGSGKTEVYLRAAERVLERGGGVLYLVPEIGLTPLLLSKIAGRFPGRAAVLHSGLARGRRAAIWQAVRRGDYRVVVGTRSAVFAPVNRLGLIVVDEEQDGSYKQEETPRYNGRDLAVVRARATGAVLLLGSATPSMESFRHARAGRYGLLRLGGRIERRPLARVARVDMREQYRTAGEVRALSSVLGDALRGCLERGEQALVLRNRRGWAVALLCPRCGERVGCPRCSIAMTWHRGVRRLRCHYCAFEQGFPDRCPGCGAEELKPIGEGTERIEAELRSLLPEARIERMDRDTIRGRGAHERLLRSFERGEIDVLVGTQMIAKGHDFPRVTLVGVLSADQTLGLPDFRAGERTFQLLTQVAGRAGRGAAPGSVVVQAFDPDHPVLRLAAAQDYEAFYDREIGYRRALRYPPVSALVRLVIHDADAGRARGWADILADALREEGGGRLLLAGPGPAPLERIRDRYRTQVLVRSAGRRRLVEAVGRALRAVEGRVPARAILVDVDPLNLL